MALKSVRAWTGRIRAHIKESNEELQTLINYNTKHPGSNFLAAGDVTNIQTVQTLLTTLFNAKRMR